MTEKKVPLYEIREDVECLKCNHKGAVKFFGNLTKPEGKISRAIGFGGTIPYRCLNCGNTGLIDFGGLECYEQAFKTKKE